MLEQLMIGGEFSLNLCALTRRHGAGISLPYALYPIPASCSAIRLVRKFNIAYHGLYSDRVKKDGKKDRQDQVGLLGYWLYSEGTLNIGN